jgi:hypothetical protein
VGRLAHSHLFARSADLVRGFALGTRGLGLVVVLALSVLMATRKKWDREWSAATTRCGRGKSGGAPEAAIPLSNMGFAQISPPRASSIFSLAVLRDERRRLPAEEERGARGAWWVGEDVMQQQTCVSCDPEQFQGQHVESGGRPGPSSCRRDGCAVVSCKHVLFLWQHWLYPFL